MPNELKPEDVMSALECCTFNPKCDECPLGGEDCINLDQLALALLREKDALIAKHEAYIDTLNEDKSCLVEQIEKKDAEIERLKLEHAAFEGAAKQIVSALKAENESLIAQIEHCDACDRIGLTHTEHMYCIKQAKSEAITEFAERLKSEVNGGQFASYKGLEIRNVIDQIAKEMKEGKR